MTQLLGCVNCSVPPERCGRRSTDNEPSPGGQINRMGGTCHPDDLPVGYHTAVRGQSMARSAAVGVEGLPADVRAVGLASGRRDGTQQAGERQQGPRL